MVTTYDKDLCSFIESNGFSDVIKIDEKTDDIIKEIEQNFVVGFSGIDWEQNEVIYSQKLDSSFEIYLNEARIFLEKIGVSFPHLLSERIFVIGDNLTNQSYEMTFENFINIFVQFLSIPQHTYIWFPDSKKCINFSFEYEVYFG